MNTVYMDYAATSPLHPDVLEAMKPYMYENFGNPSSIHDDGQRAKTALEESRQAIAGFIGADPEEIVFTGSGTEADNMAIKGIAWANRSRGNHIITSSIEHHAVEESVRFLAGQGFEATFLPVDEHGLVDPDEVKKAVTSKTTLISVMHANNEVGTVQPVAEIGKIAREAGVYFHTDAVQTLGQIEVNVNSMNADLLSVSAHKLYGPKGVGALYIRKGTRITPLVHGGGQERGLRAGTENTAGIAGFGAAVLRAEKEMDREPARLRSLRDRLIRGVRENIDDVKLNGHPVLRLPNNANFSFRYVEGESIVLNLNFDGISASTGSACTSSSLKPSHVLLAMGLSSELAHGSLRLSIGKWTTAGDIDRVIDALPKVISKLRAMSPLVKTGNRS